MCVRVSIDDFGTGYSSLSSLKRFPVDTVEIDRSLVRDICEDADGAAIVGAIIALGSSLNMSTVAEVVETPSSSSSLPSTVATPTKATSTPRQSPEAVSRTLSISRAARGEAARSNWRQ